METGSEAGLGAEDREQGGCSLESHIRHDLRMFYEKPVRADKLMKTGFPWRQSPQNGDAASGPFLGSGHYNHGCTRVPTCRHGSTHTRV